MPITKRNAPKITRIFCCLVGLLLSNNLLLIAQNNQAISSQDGYENEVTIIQIGEYNRSGVHSPGIPPLQSLGLIYQEGYRNTGELLQEGKGNYATFIQVGEYNDIDIDQHGWDNAVGDPDLSHNPLGTGVIQYGDHNTAIIDQDGEEHQAWVRQLGHHNTATVIQTGERNRAVIIQRGNGNVARHRQGNEEEE